jgi:spermidine/putrescine transport system ATP-binding protein/putrescine transport system ATP-binding protein
MNPLLTITDVRRSFGDVVALDSVSLEIHENEFFALLGPSGCGKTTLLRVLAGFEHPDSGTVMIDDRDLLAIPPNHRPINLMFQSYALFPHMSVEKNVAYGLEREGCPKDEIRDRVAQVLSTVGLSDKARRRPAQLSGGQRQRVALARAIVKRPRLLLLDEPLSALDRKVRAEMQLELKRLQHEVGITFVVVTHDQEEAMSMADRIAVMSNGRVEQIASPVELYARPSTAFVADFVGSSNAFHGRRVPEGVDVPGIGHLPGLVVGEQTSEAAVLIVRPEDVRLVSESESRLTGLVLDTQFYGGRSTVAVEVAGHLSPVIFTCQGTASVVRGAHVHLAWAPEKGVLLSAPVEISETDSEEASAP